MPSVTLHVHLANQVLQEFQNCPRMAPFDPEEAAFVNAFRHGALGPDLGYFPGGVRFLSDLAHCVRGADLARVLVRRARTPLERAFAWGWVTHVLADQRIHPYVGLGVGELRTGSASRFISGDLDQIGHVRVETGLDAWFSREHPEVREVPLVQLFDEASIGFVASGYQETYRVTLDPSLFLRSHRATARLAVRALSTIGAMGNAFLDPTPCLSTRLAKVVLEGLRNRLPSRLGGRSLALAYVTPVSPSPWLVRSTMDEVAAFPTRFMELLRGGLETLENRNLDTGEPEEHWWTHGATVRTLQRLGELGGAGLCPPRPRRRTAAPAVAPR